MTGLERRIAEAIVDDALRQGYTISVDDGGGRPVTNSADRMIVLNALESTEQDVLIFLRDGQQVGWVSLVWGNDADLICDATNNRATDAILRRAEDIADELS